MLVETAKCLNPYMNGIRGLIVERRRNSFLILTPTGALKVVPKGALLVLRIQGGELREAGARSISLIINAFAGSPPTN